MGIPERNSRKIGETLFWKAKSQGNLRIPDDLNPQIQEAKESQS